MASGGLANPAAYASRLTSQIETLISPETSGQHAKSRILANPATVKSRQEANSGESGYGEIQARSEFWRLRLRFDLICTQR